jgi:broad specificity phosphatase PhoE
VDNAIFARHGESEFSVHGIVSGDPLAPGGGLTEAGREQARALGRALTLEPVDLCVTSEFLRARETADVALEGRDVPRVVLPELNDIRIGDFEGRTLDEYRRWVRHHDPTAESPGGGESRAAVSLRYAAAFRWILARPEQTILVVSHSLPVRYALIAAEDQNPSAVVELVEYAVAHRLSRAELERAASRLEAWAAAPVFAR